MLIDVISLLMFLVIPFPKQPWTVHGISAHYFDAMFFISIERICCYVCKRSLHHVIHTSAICC